MANIESTVDRLQQCVTEIHRWCSSRRLQMNPHKTELIWFESRTNLQNLAAVPGTSSLTVTRDVVQGIDAVLNLGVTLDSKLSMQKHDNKVARTCFYHIRQLKQVRKLLGPDVVGKLITSLVFSRLDYCNAVLAGLPRSTIAPLQWVQNVCGAYWSTLSRDPDPERPLLATRQTANCVQTMPADASSSHRKSALLSLKLRHCISRHHFLSLSALHQQSTIRTAAHVSKVWRTFIFLCRTNSVE